MHSAAKQRSPSAKPAPGALATTKARKDAALPAEKAKPHFEFGGPLGAGALLIFLPLLAIVYADAPASHWELQGLLEALQSGSIFLHWSTPVFINYILYFLALACLYALLPCKHAQGAALRTGPRLSYPLNGFASLALVVGLCSFEWSRSTESRWESLSSFSVSFLPSLDDIPALALAATAFSFALSAFLYLASFRKPAPLLAEGGDTGSVVYDFFIGRELNPRFAALPDFDLKYFCELRPGLILWLLINLACLSHSAQSHGGTPTLAVSTVVGFQGCYVLDALWNEEAILSTMDIVTDGFGWMLVFGDLVWVPFLYSLQARYLVQAGEEASTPLLCSSLALGAVGLWIFRASNSEKDAFKKDPKSARFNGMMTFKAGKSTLLAGGWWGVSRHINYLGDWLLSVAWTLPCGFASPLPWFYPLYFAVLLIHREARDGEKCSKKYGEVWELYKKQVPWKIIPGVY